MEGCWISYWALWANPLRIVSRLDRLCWVDELVMAVTSPLNRAVTVSAMITMAIKISMSVSPRSRRSSDTLAAPRRVGVRDALPSGHGGKRLDWALSNSDIATTAEREIDPAGHDVSRANGIAETVEVEFGSGRVDRPPVCVERGRRAGEHDSVVVAAILPQQDTVELVATGKRRQLDVRAEVDVPEVGVSALHVEEHTLLIGRTRAE